MLDFNKVIQYSMTMCLAKSIGKCATYVKKAFERGGCKYISGNGWDNQKWCRENGFKLIGDFVPINGNPRTGGDGPNGLQFPSMGDGSKYVQQTGDVCLIKHGIYGHICYAMGPGLNDWVSDFFQRPPGQRDKCGPYCYQGNIERVQIWRHESVLNGAPIVTYVEKADNNEYRISPTFNGGSYTPPTPVVPTEISSMHDDSKKKTTSGVVLGYHMRQK